MRLSDTHSLLKRQLGRLGLHPDAAPNAAAWKLLLALVEQSYLQADQNRELVERSMALSSAEMRTLNDRLRNVNQELESRAEARTAELLAERGRATTSLYFSQVLHALRDVESADAGEFMRTATQAAARALKVERASVWLFDAERSAIVCRDLFRDSEAVRVQKRIERNIDKTVEANGMAVGGGLNAAGGGDHAAASGPAIDIEGLAEYLAECLRRRPQGDIVRAAHGIRHDDTRRSLVGRYSCARAWSNDCVAISAQSTARPCA